MNKRIRFPGKVIVGGFSTKPHSIIYSGSREQLHTETERMVSEAGSDSLEKEFWQEEGGR